MSDLKEEKLSSIKDLTDEWWFSHSKNIAEMVDSADLAGLHRLFNQRFIDGGQWAVRSTSQLAPYINKFAEMLVMLGVFDDKINLEDN